MNNFGRCFCWLKCPLRAERENGDYSECEFYHEGRQGEGTGRMLGGPKFRNRPNNGRGKGLGFGRGRCRRFW